MCPQLLMLLLVHGISNFSHQLNIYFGGPISPQVVTNILYKQTTRKGNYGTAYFFCKSAGLLPLFYIITMISIWMKELLKMMVMNVLFNWAVFWSKWQYNVVIAFHWPF